MKINGPKIKQLISIQALSDIKDNKLILFALSLDSEKATVIKTIQEELSLNTDELKEFVKIFQENDLLTKKDLDIIKRLEKTKLIEVPTHNEEAADIMNHLNILTGSKRKVTEKRLSLISNLLKKGFTVEQFKLVNSYFFSKWGKDPKMSDYLVAETLYNTKFSQRVESSEEAYELILKFKSEINSIFRLYIATYSKFIKLDLEYTRYGDIEVFSLIPFELEKRIAFWLNKGVNKDNLEYMIEATIKDWSSKEELIPHINLERMLDQKFEDRMEIAMKKKSLLISDSSDNCNAGVSAAEEWLKDS